MNPKTRGKNFLNVLICSCGKNVWAADKSSQTSNNFWVFPRELLLVWSTDSAVVFSVLTVLAEHLSQLRKSNRLLSCAELINIAALK